MATSTTFNFNRVLSHALRDEESIDRTLFERFSNHHFTVSRTWLSFDQFRKDWGLRGGMAIKADQTILHVFCCMMCVFTSPSKTKSGSWGLIGCSGSLAETDNQSIAECRVWQWQRFAFFG